MVLEHITEIILHESPINYHSGHVEWSAEALSAQLYGATTAKP